MLKGQGIFDGEGKICMCIHLLYFNMTPQNKEAELNKL